MKVPVVESCRNAYNVATNMACAESAATRRAGRASGCNENDTVPGEAMKNFIDEIFAKTFDRQQIVGAINENLQPVLHGRRGEEEREEYFKKLSFCLGYHVKKVEILKSIIFTYFKHNTIKKNMDREQILASVEGILSAETDMKSLIETGHAFYDKTLFKSYDQRDASYLMSCMKLIIEACLLVDFIHYVSNSRHKSILSFSPDKLIDMFGSTLKAHTGEVFQSIMKSM